MKAVACREIVFVGALASIALGAVSLAPTRAHAQALTHEIIIEIASFKALDKLDELSNGDVYARVTIEGEVLKTPVVSGKSEGKPNWTISKAVTAGKHEVKVELLDKDVSVDDPVDINKVANKRSLDFTVDTKTCRITGFSQTYKCGSKISRTGLEKKKAEIVFSVNVKKK